MSKYKKQLIVLLLILIELTSIFFAYKSFSNKDVTSIKETAKIDKKRFAMYVENIEGEYEEVEDVPFEGRHLLNLEKTTCVDNKGNELDNVISYNNNQITVTSNKTLFCYLYFDMKIDIQVDVETDGEVGVVPTTLGYNKSITCEDGTTPVWNYKYNRLEFTGINSDETKCKLTYTKDTNTYKNLRDTVENDDTVVVPTYTTSDYTNAMILSEDQYINVEKYYNSSSFSTSGTEATDSFAYSDNSWSSVPENLTSSKYYHIKTYVPENGYYQLCYTLSSGHSYNTMYLFVNTTQTSINSSSSIAASSTDKKGCEDLGYLTTDDYVRVVQAAYRSSSSSSPSTLTFNLQKGEEKTYDLGYRYTGTNPNNYVWFNNEMWRIIGSIPTKVSEDGTTENLVKIIRKDSIGNLIYNNIITEEEWGTNTLYTILNEYYYGKKDATGLIGCMSGYGSTYLNCNYRTNGISSDDNYGKMIKNVYWNTGVSKADIEYIHAAGESLKKYEEASQNLLGKVGIMTASDYGLGASKEFHSIALGSYNTEEITKSNWLFSVGNEWISTSSPWYYHWQIASTGNITSGNIKGIGINAVRPVVYLDSSVYIFDGTGTEADPYQIAIN